MHKKLNRKNTEMQIRPHSMNSPFCMHSLKTAKNFWLHHYYIYFSHDLLKFCPNTSGQYSWDSYHKTAKQTARLDMKMLVHKIASYKKWKYKKELVSNW